jgi:hypothetical protein
MSTVRHLTGGAAGRGGADVMLQQAGIKPRGIAGPYEVRVGQHSQALLKLRALLVEPQPGSVGSRPGAITRRLLLHQINSWMEATPACGGAVLRFLSSRDKLTGAAHSSGDRAASSGPKQAIMPAGSSAADYVMRAELLGSHGQQRGRELVEAFKQCRERAGRGSGRQSVLPGNSEPLSSAIESLCRAGAALKARTAEAAAAASRAPPGVLPPSGGPLGQWQSYLTALVGAMNQFSPAEVQAVQQAARLMQRSYAGGWPAGPGRPDIRWLPCSMLHLLLGLASL